MIKLSKTQIAALEFANRNENGKACHWGTYRQPTIDILEKLGLIWAKDDINDRPISSYGITDAGRNYLNELHGANNER